MKRLLLVLPILALALIWWFYRRSSAPPEVPFTKVKRETLVSNLVTNGKVEPLEWVEIRAEQAGIVDRVLAEAGQPVARGAILAELDASNARAELKAAEAQVTRARSEIEVLQRGGRAPELAEIDSALSRARLDAGVAGKEVDSLRRLVEKQAATRVELDQAAQRLDRARSEIQALERKRAVLVTDTDRTAAESRLREAEASAELARRKIANSLIRSPIGGIVYEKDARVGSYLSPGDPVAKVGQIEKVRVRVYVDEPELGRVAQGVPVTITWDALPGRKWAGRVERMPTGIVAMGTRQVGEVICIIENPDRDLLPGTNINAEIRSRVVENALTLPREALRRQSEQPGVFVLQGVKVDWRNVVLGTSSVTRTQVVSGLAEGDAVALPSDTPLQEGLVVRPVYR